MEEEEESSRPCVECEVPRELLLHRSELIPPPVQCKEEDVEKNGYRQTHRLTEMQHTDPDQSKDWAG